MNRRGTTCSTTWVTKFTMRVIDTTNTATAEPILAGWKQAEVYRLSRECSCLETQTKFRDLDGSREITCD